MSVARAAGEWSLWLVLGLVVAAGVATLPEAFPPALAALALVVAPVTFGLLLMAPRSERGTLLALFLGAVAVRAGLAIVADQTVPHGFFSLDDRRYELLGVELARHWSGEGPAPLLNPPFGYYVWNAFLFHVFGNYPLVPKLVNAGVGGLTVLLVHSLARPIGGVRAARWAAVFAAFWPSLVLWSSLNLKDVLVLLSILVMLRGAQRLQERTSLAGLLQIAFGAFGVGQLRTYLLLVGALALGIAWLAPRLRRAQGPVALALLLALGALAGPTLGSVAELGDDVSLHSLDRARHNLAVGGSAYHGDVDISSPAKALRFLPVGLAYFLLTPAPWQVWNLRQALTLPEMLAWYALLPTLAIGIGHALRTRFAVALPIVTMTLFTSFSYALVESNLGTAYRHRAQVLVLLLLFAAVGLERRRALRAERAPQLVPAAVRAT